MKRKFKLFQFLILIFFTLINICTELKSDCEVCGQWEGPYQMIISGPLPGTVIYYKKFCNNEWLIKITQVNSANPRQDMMEVFGAVLYQILTKNPMNIPPLSPLDGKVKWKIMRNSCWHYTNGEKTSMEPCSDLDCCITEAEVEKKDNCGLVFSIISEEGTVVDCEPFGLVGDNCFDICIPTKIMENIH